MTAKTDESTLHNPGRPMMPSSRIDFSIAVQCLAVMGLLLTCSCGHLASRDSRTALHSKPTTPEPDTPPATRLLFAGDFEDGDLTRLGDSERHKTLRKVRLVESPVRYGGKALELTLDREKHQALRNHRTDFWIRGMSRTFRMGQAYWYGFSTLWPESWQPDTQAELFVQWIGKGTPSPPLAIYIYGEAYRIKRRWGRKTGDYRNLWSGPVAPDRGTWADWVFRVIWSPDANGRVDVWKNGRRILSDQGPNCAQADVAPYFKFGLYKWPWKRPPDETPSTVTRRTLIIDEIRIAAGPDGYDLVLPYAKRTSDTPQ